MPNKLGISDPDIIEPLRITVRPTYVPTPDPGDGQTLVPTQEATPIVYGSDWQTPALPIAPSGYKLTPVEQPPEFLPDYQVPTGMKKLLGVGGEERYQLWPEKMVRSGLSLPGEVAAGKIPLPGDAGYGTETTTIEPNWLGQMMGMTPWEGSKTPEVIERAMDTTGLMGGSVFSKAHINTPMPANADTGLKSLRVLGKQLFSDNTVPSVGIQAAREALRDLTIKYNELGKISDDLSLGKRNDLNVNTISKERIKLKDEIVKLEYYIDKNTTMEQKEALRQKHALKQGYTDETYHGARSPWKEKTIETEGPANQSEFYSTPTKPLADMYAGPMPQETSFTQPNVMPLRINSSNYHRVDAGGRNWMEVNRQAIRDAKAQGKDGVIIENVYDEPNMSSVNPESELGYPQTVYITFNPGTVRSANAAFNPSQFGKSGLMLSDTGTPGVGIAAMGKAPPFYSALERAVQTINQNKGSGDQWLGTLRNAKGVKPEELEWTGVNEFLKGKSNVTKQELQNFINSNKVELKEVNKGVQNPEAIVAKQEFDNYSQELANKYDLNPLQNLAMYGKIKRMLPEEIAKYEELQRRYIDLNGNQVKTKYSQWQLPGGENYREMLLTLPDKNMERQIAIQAEQRNLRNNLPRTNETERATFNERMNTLETEMQSLLEKGSYHSSHWDEPNILAHIRMNDRTIDGKKSLHLEEIQSDWHQQGRDKGYKGDHNLETLKSQLKEAETKLNEIMTTIRKEKGLLSNEEAIVKELSQVERAKLVDLRQKAYEADARYIEARKENQELLNQHYKANTAVPDAPFKKTWHELALKRMIREAAEKGYDRLSWTPGEAQAARYDLSKQIDRLIYEGNHLMAYKDNKIVISEQNVPKDKLADYVGKEAAEKLVNAEMIKTPSSKGYQELKGLELKIGGEGMKGFYDQIIPKSLEKIGKEFGVKVKKTNDVKINAKDFYDKNKFDNDPMWEQLSERERQYQTQYYSKHLSNNEPIFYIDIPQSMRDTVVGKGQPLFSSGFVLNPVEGNPFDTQSDKWKL